MNKNQSFRYIIYSVDILRVNKGEYMYLRRKVLLFSFYFLLILVLTDARISAQDSNLQAVGALSSANLYLTYVSIGAVADSHSRELYKDEFAISILTSITGITKNSIGSLHKVLESENLDEDDINYLKDTIDTLEVLIEQAESYKTYIEKDGSQYTAIYNNYKQIAWQQVAKLLCFEQENPSQETGK